ncbi:hypothetical protein KP509_09G019500 [Ceratopteris richardii]|nr:hypothetical protein KP509_09G019500 [Ceratopteris richardii]
MVPSTMTSRQILSQRFLLSNAILKREISGNIVGKSLNFIYAGKLQTTKGGLKAGSSSTLHLRSGAHLNSLSQWTSPLGVVLGPNVQQSMYCHLLCGLLQTMDVTVVTSFLAYALTEAFRFLEEVWEELCNDIATGTLSDRVTDVSVRSAVLELLRCDDELAKKIRSECLKGWSSIIKRLWPNVVYIHTIVTGAMEPYVPYLKDYAGNVPIVCGDYGSSECTVGINLNPRAPPDEVIFTLVPYAAYFEFLELDWQEGEKLVDLTNLEIGKEYEIIVTTITGLYRYRLGDVIRITGYYFRLPQFAFARRKNVMLSINTDKTDEKELCEVVKQASARLEAGKMDLLEFTSYADHSSRPGHYTIFWELKGTVFIEDSILQFCCEDLDSSFNDPYQRGRAAGTIGPLELCIVKEGTFYNVMKFVLQSGLSPTQYKTPRCIKCTNQLNILRSSVMKIYTPSH